MRSLINGVVPAKAGTHQPPAFVDATQAKATGTFRANKRHGVWVPAFAGTTPVIGGRARRLAGTTG
jgi:hypothetical protein